MAISLTSSGVPLLLGAGQLALLSAMSGGGGGTVPTGPAPLLSTVSGLTGWWDAGTISDLLSGGNPIASWGASVNALRDKSGAGHNASAQATSAAIPRLAGLLGGVGSIVSPSNYTLHWPYLDPNGGWSVSGVPVGADGSLTVYLVWSRPELVQVGAGPTTNAAPLLSIAGTTVLDMTGTGSTDTLRLFPNGTPATGGALERRHTHSARVCFSTSGVDVWLDGAKVISGAANQMAPFSSSVAMTFLTKAQCHFHEAGAWPRALSAADHAQLSACAARWPAGARQAANGVAIGQSNCGNFVSNYTLCPVLAKGANYWSGRIAGTLFFSGAASGPATIYSGKSLYSAVGKPDAGDFLDSTGGGDPSTWPLGTNGQQFQSWVNGLTADQSANMAYVFWYWSEADSTRSYSEKATFAAAIRRAFSLIRSMLGRTAATLPVGVINALPFSAGTTADPGTQVHREAMADLIADPSQNVFMMLANSSDAIAEGNTWSATTGLETGTADGAHRDGPGAINYAHRMGLSIGRAVVAAGAAAGKPDQIGSVPAGVPLTGGPTIGTCGNL